VFDPDFQFHYLRARWYNPKSGRFLQRDSLFGTATVPGSLHRYAYAQHNPLVYLDPTGHQAWYVDHPGVPCPIVGALCGPEPSWAGYEGYIGGLYGPCSPYTVCGGGPLAPEPPSISFWDVLAAGAIQFGLGSLIGIPARPYQYPPGSREAVNTLGALYGCHTCGARLPPGEDYIRDHWPPSSLIRQRVYPPGQVLLPQCPACNEIQRQAAAQYVRMRRMGVPHEELLDLFERIVTPYSRGWPYGR
jgi:RHS repeat-associated protein